MRVLFMGTPDFAAKILRAIADHHEIVCAITRPDAVRKRGKALVPSDVAQAANELGVAVYKCDKLDDDAFAFARGLNPDVVCVAAFGALLQKRFLELAPYGAMNVHASLLPRWRGAAPIERAILAGDEYAGVSIMKMEEGLDTGAYCAQRRIETAGKTASELTEMLADIGASALIDVLSALECGESPEWIEQDEAQVTYAEKIRKSELFVNPDMDAKAIDACVRASSDAHPARAIVAGREVTLERVVCVCDEGANSLAEGIQPGYVSFIAKRMFLGCAHGLVEVLNLKPTGKNSMDARAFCAGIPNIKTAGSQWGGIDA